MIPGSIPFVTFDLSVNSWLMLFGASAALSFAVAALIGKERNIGFWGSLMICMIISSIAGLLVTLLSKTKAQQRAENKFYERVFNPVSVEDELNQLVLLKQCGLISKTEYEEEKNRLLDS